MSVMWTPLRLTMSSSPQISRPDGHTRISTSSSSLISSSGSSRANPSIANFYPYVAPAQQETVRQKETVRISPPLHQKEIPISAYYANGHLKGVRTEPHLRNSKIKNVYQPFDENKFIIDDHSYRKFERVDRECQTDNRLRSEEEISLRNMANDEYEMDPINSDLYPEVVQYQDEQTINSHESRLDDNSQNHTDIESKDRDVDDIEIITAAFNAEEKGLDNIDCISEQPRLNGSAISEDYLNSKNQENFTNSHKHTTTKNNFEEEKDTCCTSCLLTTLNICDCVIL